ncbi:MAG: hypothetical protein KDI88_05090 [Gammaproteobacteria bacterium]|nr:hypothetical protein [Gammaproteobacteria bacterium]
MYRPVSSLSCLVLFASSLFTLQVAAADPEIEALKQQLLDLQQRVEKLEAGLATTDAAVEAVKPPEVVPGGWRKQANWRVLDKGMETHRVEEILGAADSTRRVGKFEYWEYGNGLLRFYLGRLKSWEIPDGIDPD